MDEHDLEQFLLPDLLSGHAAGPLDAVDRDDDFGRLLAWYRRQGAFADRAVTGPGRFRVVDDELDGENPFSRETALEWLRSERVNLVGMVRLAAESGCHTDVIALCDGPLWALHEQGEHAGDTLEALSAGVASAVALADPVAEARMRGLRGRLLVERGEVDDALVECAEAVAVAEGSGHRRVLAAALQARGEVLQARGEHAAAVEDFQRARREISEG
ncbi:hypothetical protein [Saccharopolyspora hordei]|uniref:Tetratricopeptide (TPR) repeat protein n=1 Tax=Saccharopolyspora hordei TaxID=1838 RepID=A0A853AC29_9PSEU|nr:hypothetical protein [Saccharopolyspora hordei]NYI81468.1 tetratricopeptide (TPR) repeat protein [Saccharopolyspora hordei]